MADPEGHRGKRSEHEERMSRVFDEVMGLGPFADTSRGSASSSRSSGVEDTPNKEGEDASRPGQEVSRSFDEVMGLGPFSATSSRSSPMDDTPNKEDEDVSRPVQNEERLSRSFDEVMGLGPFADTSRGSASSSRSSGVEKTPTKEDEDSSRQGEGTPPRHKEERVSRLFDEVMGPGPFCSAPSSICSGSPTKETEDSTQAGGVEEDSNTSGRDERMNEDEGETERLASHSSDGQRSPTAMETEEKGKLAYGEPSGKPPTSTVRVVEGEEEEDEDWQFALPMGSLEDAEKGRETPAENDPFATVPAEEDQEKGDGSDSANTSHSSQDGGVPIPPKPSAVTEDGQQRPEPAVPAQERTISPVNIKDEPVDEGYDAALLPQNSIKHIKEELDNQEEESLKISNVYSVGGASSFVAPTMPVPVSAPIAAPHATTFFIPGRGHFQVQASGLQPISIRPPIVAPNLIRSLAPVPQQPRPPPPPQPGTPSSVSCSGCSKVLLKGQTAFQRKGSTQLFCSTVCLTGHLPTTSKARSCYQCLKEITQAKDLVMAPIDANNYMHFCSHFCLFVFNRKRKSGAVEKPAEKPAEKPVEKPACSVCRVTTKIEHEVTHLGRLHKLCSDACFGTWRKTRQLAMNCCDGCGLYCKSDGSSCQTLSIDKSPLNFCSPTCISTYKQTCTKMTECGNCQKMVQVSSTTMERDHKGKIQLYCTPLCVEKSRSPRHVLSGTSFPCSLCKTVAVPQYHLAMVDGTIRNFCSIDCVTVFRKKAPTSPEEILEANGTSPAIPRQPLSQRDTPPGGQGPPAGEGPPSSSVPPLPREPSPPPVPYPGHHPSHTLVPPLVSPYSAVPTSEHPPKPSEGDNPTKVTCHHCRKLFDTKPLLFSYEGQISMFCGKTCCEQYKTQKNILIVCDHCKLERVVYEILNYNQQDRVFCSERCKLLFKHEQSNGNKEQSWRACSYCSSVGHRMLHSNYSGKMEEFCKPHCMSQYTVLYYGMARCDSCRKQGYMAEKLQCSGSVRTFCGLPCLLQYCHHYFEAGQQISTNGTTSLPPPYAPRQPHHSSKINPVIGDVVSLASSSSSQPQVTADTALSGALPPSNTHGKNIDNASTQTDAPSRRRQMKNKAVLCRPFTVDQETLCELAAPDTQPLCRESAAGVSQCCSCGGVEKVRLVMVPVPVPVFVPVPMNMYSQHTPVPLAMPMPVPVPLVLPHHVKEMKDAAVQWEPLAEAEKGTERDKKIVSRGDQVSTHSGEAVTRLSLDSEDPQTEGNAGQAEPRRTTAREEESTESKDTLTMTTPGDPLKTTQTEHSHGTDDNTSSTSVDQQPPLSPMMDLESDLSPERYDLDQSAPRRGLKRTRDSSHSRKRGKRRVLDRSALSTRPKLNHLYGIKAWGSWVQRHNAHTDTEPRSSHTPAVKEDILQCDASELSYALCRFIKDVRRPNGGTYSADSIFYLCLGIQKYLFEKGRIENIFTDELYSQFSLEIANMLQHWKPELLPSGGLMPSRVQEAYLWDCKQLGAYSPVVLLNTLLFFCTKAFRFTTPAQHRQLSFANFTRRSRPCSHRGKTLYLQHRRGHEATEEDLEIPENISSPLHCPVRLYEFYMSRCPDTVKNRTDIFYLQPEGSVHTNSSHWYTAKPLEGRTLQSMLTRILAVMEVQHDIFGLGST